MTSFQCQAVELVYKHISDNGMEYAIWTNKLRFVRIYFETQTFDKIEKDRAAKFVDMLSAIGGTMGLLTGFSIISGVEILYFAAKIICNIFRKDKMIK